MIKKNTVFDFLAEVMVIYGITVISIVICTFLFGSEAKGISTMFALGRSGIPMATLMQFLLMAFLVSVVRWICFTDKLIKNASIAVRSIVMIVSIILIAGVFAAIFGWFPVNMTLPWVMFIICFAVYAAIGTVVSVLKERSENKKLQEALERLKGDEESCQMR